MAQSLIDVFSVTIFPNCLPSEVYGNIVVFDESNSEQTHKLYERSLELPEVLSEIGQVLLLKGLDIVLSMRKPVMSIVLRDKAHNHAFIANGGVHFENKTSNDYEEIKSSLVAGDCGHAFVNYIALASAHVAKIFIELNNYDASSSRRVPAFGSIVARYGKTYGRITCDTSTKNFSTTLLKIPSNQSMPLSSEGERQFLQLERNLVAVPAYSSLVVEANLREISTNKHFFYGTAVKTASMWYTYSSVHDDLDKHYRYDINDENAILYVSFLEPFVLQHSYNKARLCHWSMMPKEVEFSYGEHLLEVFSVFIGRDNDDDLSVSGLITVKHEGGSLVIFNRVDKNPDRLLDGRKLLSITGPSSPSDFMYAYEYFNITLELKDADDRLLIKRGFMDYNGTTNFNAEFAYDRLFCAVMQGERGYCAIHYTNFSRAERMAVNCVLLCKGIDVAGVYGRIVAWSDFFYYASDYDKKCYRRILFDKPEDDVDILEEVVSKKTKYDIPDDKVIEVKLSRSYLALPVGSILYIEVNLYASSNKGRGPAEHLQDTLQFQLGDDSPKIIPRKYYDILLHVERIQGPGLFGY